MTSHPSPSNPYRLLDTIQAARCSNHLSWPRSQASSFFERPCSRSRAASHPSEGGAAGGVFRGQGEAEGEGEDQAQLEGVELLQIDATNLGPGKGSESAFLQELCLAIF